jgi:hypothetical protein
MYRRRVTRELDALTSDAGSVVACVCSEIGAIPVERQRPPLVAEVLGLARVVGDPESASVAPRAFELMMRLLDECIKGVDGD